MPPRKRDTGAAIGPPPDAGRCTVMKKAGGRCKLPALPGGETCQYHGRPAPPMPPDTPIEHTVGSGNVFADLGLPDAGALYAATWAQPVADLTAAIRALRASVDALREAMARQGQPQPYDPEATRRALFGPATP